MIWWLGLFVIALAVVIKSADVFVSGAASAARKMGMSAFVVGLTIVAIGTSAPEVVVNTIAASQGNTSLSIGNVVGSNIVNILLGLGLAAIFVPLTIKKQTVWKELPFTLLAALLVLVLGADCFFGECAGNVIGRADSLVLFSFFIIFIVYTFGLSSPEGEDGNIEVFPWGKSIGLILAGMAGLILGGKFAVQSAVEIAQILNMSENLIGLTIVAIGTSLPEIVTSIVAVRKGHVDMVVGGIVGSNIFNLFFALSITSFVADLPFTSENLFDASFLAVITIVLFMFMFVGRKHAIERWQGILFVGVYIAYITYAIIRG